MSSLLIRGSLFFSATKIHKSRQRKKNGIFAYFEMFAKTLQNPDIFDGQKLVHLTSSPRKVK